MQAQDKKDALERLERAGLQYSVINLSGAYQEIIVHEATGNTHRMMAEMVAEVDTDVSISHNTKMAVISLYIPTIACSKGDMPKTYEEFFDMKNSDIDTWVTTARKRNPQLFGLLDEQEKVLNKFLSEDAIEEKKRKRSKSRKSS